MTDQFNQVEDEYFRLKGQLQAGRITREQLESALKDMMPQDAQGRYWMLGVDDAKWYVNDGSNWVESTPPRSTTTTIDTNASRQSEPPRSSKQTFLALILLAIGLVSCLIFFGCSSLIVLGISTGARFFDYFLAIILFAIGAVALFFAWRAYRRIK